MGYKIILDNNVVDVILSPVWVKENKNGLVVRCNADEAFGIVSSDSSKTYHINGRKKFSKKECDNVIVCDISDEEANTLKTILDIGGKVVTEELEDKIEFIEQEEQELEQIDGTVSEIKERIIKAMREECNKAICAGATVTLSDGSSKHFEYSIEDQLNLISIHSQIVNGETSVIYHAKNELYREFSAEDMLSVINACVNNKTYHTLYYNSLKNWIKSMRSISKICSVKYGDTIPEKYCSESFLNLIRN